MILNGKTTCEGLIQYAELNTWKNIEWQNNETRQYNYKAEWLQKNSQYDIITKKQTNVNS
jgi:hypothetical protein